MIRRSMPSCLAGWKASAQRRPWILERDYIFRLMWFLTPCNASKHPVSFYAVNSDRYPFTPYPLPLTNRSGVTAGCWRAFIV